MYFRNYGLPKTWLDQCLKSPVSEDPTKSNMVNAPKHCSNLKDTSLPYLLITGSQLSYKKSLLVISKMSKLFPNILCANGKYSLLARDNLMQRIQMLLSRKQKTFSQFFSSFLKSSLNFQHFQKKDDPHS